MTFQHSLNDLGKTETIPQQGLKRFNNLKSFIRVSTYNESFSYQKLIPPLLYVKYS